MLKFKNETILDDFNTYKANAENRLSELKTHNEAQENSISRLKEDIENLNKRIRYLEQQNDDLERAYRNATVSLEDFESQLNSELEKNAMLENELDEKENLHVVIQRLKDETRDLQQELIARQKKNRLDLPSPQDSSPNSSKKEISDPSINSQSKVPSSKTSPTKPSSLLLSPNTKMMLSQKSPTIDILNPSVRYAAVNIISELLNKISNIESKMGALYNFYGSQIDEKPLASNR